MKGVYGTAWSCSWNYQWWSNTQRISRIPRSPPLRCTFNCFSSFSLSRARLEKMVGDAKTFDKGARKKVGHFLHFYSYRLPVAGTCCFRLVGDIFHSKEKPHRLCRSPLCIVSWLYLVEQFRQISSTTTATTAASSKPTQWMHRIQTQIHKEKYAHAYQLHHGRAGPVEGSSRGCNRTMAWPSLHSRKVEADKNMGHATN